MIPPVGILACITVGRSSAVKIRGFFGRRFASLLRSLSEHGTYGVIPRWPETFGVEQQN